MATTFETADPAVTITRFACGDGQQAIQITAPGRPGSDREFDNFVQLTRAQAHTLAADLPGILAQAFPSSL